MNTSIHAKRSLLSGARNSIGAIIAVLLSALPVAGAEKKIHETNPGYSGIDQHQLSKMYKQAPLSRAAHLIRDEVHRSKAQGFTSLRVQDDAVVLRWKGAIPANIRKSIQEAWKFADVRVEPWKYSRADLQKAARKLAAHFESDPNPTPLLHGVLVVADEYIRVLSKPGVEVTASLKQSLPMVDVPVEFVSHEPAEFTTRENDSAPWWGGAKIISERGGYFRGGCTSGFGVTNGYTEYMLTAAHCATAPDSVRDPTWEYMGLVSREDWRLDILLVGTNVGNRIYDGRIGDYFTKPVSGWNWVTADERLCSSGAVTGVVCDLTVINIWASTLYLCDSDGDCYWVRDLVVAQRPNGNPGSRKGDSGGPVFIPLSNGSVVAKGTITGVSGDLLLFQDFGTTRYTFGVWPQTVPW